MRVLLRGDARWKKVLEDQLPYIGITPVRYRDISTSLIKLKIKPVINFVRANILHQLYVDLQSGPLFTVAHRLGIRVIAHWIGSDVLKLRQYHFQHQCIPPFLNRHVDTHLADSPLLQAELTQMGIASSVVRLLPRTVDCDIEQLPKDHAVLSYWPDHRADFYRVDIVKALASHYSDMKFFIVAAEGMNVLDRPSNMIFLGEVSDMDAIYSKISILIRMVEHDSLSAMVLEALARGRYVLYSESFPHTYKVSSYDDARKSLEAVLQLTTPNVAGARYVRTNFSWQDEINKLRNIYLGRMND